MKSLETSFAEQLSDFGFSCKRVNKGIPYVRCSASRTVVENALSELGLEFKVSNLIETPISGSIRFNESILITYWRDSDIKIKTDSPGVKQKKLAPNKLINVGFDYTFASVLFEDCVRGLELHCSSEERTSCVNILTAIRDKTTLSLTPLLCDPIEKSKITSDFGEIALAYKRLCFDGGVIHFPTASNQRDFDFFHNSVPISAKGEKGSNRYLIAGNEFLPIDTLSENSMTQMFRCWQSRDIFGLLDFAAEDCTQLRYWKNKCQSITEESLLEYVEKTPYDEFVQDIRDCQGGLTLGLPSFRLEHKTRKNYKQKSLHPIMFALLTIWARYYPIENEKAFNEAASKITVNSNIVFEYFDYDTTTGNFITKLSEINKYKIWKIRYHSNANSSLNNYPALQGIK